MKYIQTIIIVFLFLIIFAESKENFFFCPKTVKEELLIKQRDSIDNELLIKTIDLRHYQYATEQLDTNCKKQFFENLKIE